MHGVIIPTDQVEEVVKDIQNNLKGNKPYYAHLYNDSEIIVIYKEKIFRMKQDRSTWREAVEYGRTLGIPDEQLVFQPHKFEDEEIYYSENWRILTGE